MMDTSTDLNVKKRKAKPAKAAIALVFALIGVIISFALSFYFSQINIDAHDKFSELRRQLINIESDSFNAQLGSSQAFDQLFSSEQSISTTLEALIQTPFRDNTGIATFSNKWQENKKYITQLLEAEQTIRMSSELAKQMDLLFPSIEAETESLIAQLIGLDVAPNLVFLASNQLSLLQGMRSNLHHLDNKQQDATKTLALIKSDSEIFNSTLDKLINGDPTIGVKPIRNAALKNSVENLKNEFKKIEEISTRMNEQMVRLNISKNAYNKVHDITHNLFDESNTLSRNFMQENYYYKIAMSSGYTLAIVCLFLAGTLLFPKNEKTEFEAFITNSSDVDDEDDSSVHAIEQLEREIAPIASGDLTINANVVPGPTESIATSINYSINALRSLIENINRSSIAVYNTAEEAQATAIHLSFASDKQAKQIGSVTNAIQKIVLLFQSMEQHAIESAELATKSMAHAENGSLSVKNMIASMRTIDEDIHETSSRIKRLGESSQEIGDIVELINEIAAQTNILALNAAIKASSGKDAHTFSTVADEIQQLAERVTQATQKIESLVTSIQLDTNQAVLAMEQSSTDVTNGSKLAEAAGDALIRIESVSAHLAQFINDVAGEASNLNKSAIKISDTMNNIKKFTEQNLAGTKQTASLNGKLAELAKSQKKAIEGFKLPEQNDTE